MFHLAADRAFNLSLWPMCCPSHTPETRNPTSQLSSGAHILSTTLGHLTGSGAGTFCRTVRKPWAMRSRALVQELQHRSEKNILFVMAGPVSLGLWINTGAVIMRRRLRGMSYCGSLGSIMDSKVLLSITQTPIQRILLSLSEHRFSPEHRLSQLLNLCPYATARNGIKGEPY